MKQRIKNVLNFKKPSRLIVVVSAALVFVVSVGFAVNQVRPFKDLSVSDIASAAVVLRPPDESFSLDENNISDLVNALHSVVTYAPDESYKEYAGQWVEYSIVKSDGAELTVAAYNPFIIIDGVGYKTKYEPCEELNRLGNQVMDGGETASNADDEAPRVYYLENMTERQQYERLSGITLYPDGKAELATPPISSYLMPDCTYAYTDNELLIYAGIETEEEEGFFGLKNGEVIAAFEVSDDNTLVFKTSAVPLFADEAARYIRYAAAVSVNPSDLYALSEMRTPFVGDNSAVGGIISALPGLDDSHTQRFFSIGDDYGTGRAPNTLTIYYEPSSPQTVDTRNLNNTSQNAAMLFALIDNLEEVNFAFRETPSSYALDKLNKSAYTSRVRQDRDDITEYIGRFGLDWDDFQNDWNGSVEKLFAEPADKLVAGYEGGGETRNMTLDDVRAIAQKIGPDLTMDDLNGFIGTEAGSGLYIMRYEIADSECELIVGAGVPPEVWYTYLLPYPGAEGDEAIDIRYYDVDKFIADGTKALVRPLPEISPEETALPRSAETTLYEGFYQIIHKLYDMDDGLNDGIKYIAVDMSGVMESEREPLELLLTSWTETLGYELLIENFEELIDSSNMGGLRADIDIRERILFTFENASFDGDKLIVFAEKYRGPLGAVMAEFTARFIDGDWVVDEPADIVMA